MFKRNMMFGLIFILLYENCILVDLFWCESVLKRKIFDCIVKNFYSFYYEILNIG